MVLKKKRTMTSASIFYRATLSLMMNWNTTEGKQIKILYKPLIRCHRNFVFKKKIKKFKKIKNIKKQKKNLKKLK